MLKPNDNYSHVVETTLTRKRKRNIMWTKIQIQLHGCLTTETAS